MRHELLYAFVERNRSAARNETIPLSLGALAERTETTKIAVATGLEQEDIQLMAGDTDARAGLVSHAQSAHSSPAQRAQPVLVINPERQVKIAAFVPDLDPFTAKFAEPRNFLP